MPIAQQILLDFNALCCAIQYILCQLFLYALMCSTYIHRKGISALVRFYLSSKFSFSNALINAIVGAPHPQLIKSFSNKSIVFSDKYL